MAVVNRTTALAAALGSGLLLAGALFFEHGMGLAPCQLCIWQRWPHLAALGLGVVVWLAAAPAVILAGALAAAGSGGIAVYHSGVEQGWWEGPSACSGAADLSGMDAAAMLDALMVAPVVRCDEIPWEMLGLSMASWNAIASFALAGLWLASLKR